MSLSANVSEKTALIWTIADKLTGVYKPHEYGEVILPLVVIRRFDCILSDTKDAVLARYETSRNLHTFVICFMILKFTHVQVRAFWVRNIRGVCLWDFY